MLRVPQVENITVCPKCETSYDVENHKPCMTGCGHNFCSKCIASHSFCPTCDKQIMDRYVNSLALEYMQQLRTGYHSLKETLKLFNSFNSADKASETEIEEVEKPQITPPPPVIHPVGALDVTELALANEIGKSKASIRMTTLPAIPPTPRQIGSNEQGGKLDFQIRGAPNEKVHRWVTSTTIRITNLEQPTEEQVRRYFSYHGLVVDSELDPSGTSAFVRYQFEHNAFQAIEKTNMSYFLNGTKKMRVEQYTS